MFFFPHRNTTRLMDQRPMGDKPRSPIAHYPRHPTRGMAMALSSAVPRHNLPEKVEKKNQK